MVATKTDAAARLAAMIAGMSTARLIDVYRESLRKLNDYSITGDDRAALGRVIAELEDALIARDINVEAICDAIDADSAA